MNPNGPTRRAAVSPNQLNDRVKKTRPLRYPFDAAAAGGSTDHVRNKPAKANGITHHAPVRGNARCSANAHTAETTAASAVGDENEMRRAGFAVLTMSMAAAACGRIVTLPKSSGANGGLVPAGNMFIRYRVLGTLDFNSLRYLVVFNTTGNGITPLPAASTQSYVNYSFILAFGGTQVSGAAYAVFQIVNSGSGGYTAVLLPLNPAYVTNFNQNSSGSSNEFTFTFNRLLLTPLAGASPSPSPTATVAKPASIAPGRPPPGSSR